MIAAKFLAGMTVVSIMAFLAGAMTVGLGRMSIGIPPEREEPLRIGSYLQLTVFHASVRMGRAMLCFVRCRHAAPSALIVIALWMYFTLLASMVTNIIANLRYPAEAFRAIAT